MAQKENYKELYNKIDILSKRLESMSRAMKGELDFLDGNGFKVIKTTRFIDGVYEQYDIYKSLDSSIRNKFINDVYKGKTNSENS